MNQILSTKLKHHKQKNNLYKIFFYDSIIIIITLTCFFVYNSININKYEKISTNLSGNYDIYKLYSKYSKPENNSKEHENEIFGIIEIPKINIKYPIFSELNDDLLKISPCRFYGLSPKEYSNLCIAGHNYDNSKFFSNLFLLNLNDNIYIYDNLDKKYIYNIFKIYEVDSSDLSPIFNYDGFSKELTLITCNNLNKNRLVVKAKQ